ncbi:tyrosine-protein phosphatase non-receptor type substrate 1-like [Alligator mississippiensis]|uniref:tyrosine-protein phosphatase non-receptor type substrate 1-like n=1 Tax=Alligator mississippiensis TaxID=8496 RepID=UPI002877B735|nr:tyrosine-protein phosphatase non-receptor type substrate 1-like [Alligator mississippiensis]
MSEISQPQSVTAGKKVTLSCRVAGHFPGELGVTWLRKGRGEARAAPLQDSAEYQLVPGQPVPAADGKSFQQEAKLLFTPSVRRDQGAEYICRVGHAALQTPAERCSTELQVTASPELSGIQVLPRWDPPEEVPFAVDLQNFLPREIHCIEWSVDGKAWERSEPSDWRENEDGSFSARSVWRVPSCRLTSTEQRVRVSVQHQPRDRPIEGELSLADTGLLQPPDVSEISQPQAVTVGREVALSCRVAGHFPGELGVTWLRKGRGEARAAPLQDSAEYRFVPGRPVPAADGKSFQQEPRLVLTAVEKGDLGAVFICRVKHIALETPIEGHSGELQVTGHQDAPMSQDPESMEGKADEGAPGDVSGSHDGTKEGTSVQEQGAGALSSEEDGDRAGAPRTLTVAAGSEEIPAEPWPQPGAGSPDIPARGKMQFPDAGTVKDSTHV